MSSNDVRPTPDLDAVLERFDRARDPDVRAAFGVLLAALRGYRDDRILTALVRVLQDTPRLGIPLLRHYGDPRGGEHLSRAFDRIARGGQFCTCHLAEVLEQAAEAMEALGTELTSDQVVALDMAQDRADTLAMQGHGHGQPPPRPIRAEPRTGRNTPCPCGSGRKYKKCCLGVARS